MDDNGNDSSFLDQINFTFRNFLDKKKHVYLWTHHPYSGCERTYIYIPAASKGCCLNPKGWCFSASLIIHSAPLGRSRYIYIQIPKSLTTSSKANYTFVFTISLPCHPAFAVARRIGSLGNLIPVSPQFRIAKLLWERSQPKTRGKRGDKNIVYIKNIYMCILDI